MQNTLTLIETETEDNTVIKRYECDFIANCDGTSLWGDTANKQVRVTGITVFEEKYEEGDDDVYTSVNVTHDAEWQIYTDKGFEQAISDVLGLDVAFTEQGMQEDNFASMEAF